MTLILNAPPKKRNSLNQLLGGISAGAGSIGSMLNENEQRKMHEVQLGAENEAAEQLGINLRGIRDPKMRQEILKQQMQLKNAPEMQRAKYDSRLNALKSSPIGKYLSNGQQEESPSQINQMNEQGEMDIGNVKVPSMVPEEQIYQAELLGEHGLAQQFRDHNKQILESDRHAESLNQKEILASKKETMPLRKQYADQAKYAKDAQKNKQQQINLIKKGNIDSPERVFFSSLLPGALGNKLLSSDTQLYRAGLFEEFGVLKSMFPGQIRVKEIELLEDKLASLEKSHEAKEKILETGIKKLEIPKIKAKAAQRVEKEYPKASLLEFEELVDRYAEEDLEKAYEGIANSYNKIYFEYAPEKSTLIDKDGTVYKDIPKNLLESFYMEGEKEGLELRPL